VRALAAGVADQGLPHPAVLYWISAINKTVEACGPWNFNFLFLPPTRRAYSLQRHQQSPPPVTQPQQQK
jgi:hypothetical protein